MTGSTDRAALTPITPKAITSSVWAIGGICALLALAARTTGAGWLVVIMCLLLGGLIVGLAVPFGAVMGIQLTAIGPTDAIAGDPIVLDLHSNRPGVGLLVRSAPHEDWQGLAGADGAQIAYTAPFRGVYESLSLEVCCGVPFGISWRRRTLTVPLRRAVLVAPRTVADDTVHDAHLGHGDRPAAAQIRGDEQLRSVRDYVRGDPLRLVHWPATARRGELIVKELEAQAGLHIRIVVELSGVQEPDERTAERAMGVVQHALDSGNTIELVTNSADGVRIARIDGHLAAGRQLALATAGRVSAGVGTGVDQVVHLSSGARE